MNPLNICPVIRMVFCPQARLPSYRLHRGSMLSTSSTCTKSLEKCACELVNPSNRLLCFSHGLSPSCLTVPFHLVLFTLLAGDTQSWHQFKPALCSFPSVLWAPRSGTWPSPASSLEGERLWIPCTGWVAGARTGIRAGTRPWAGSRGGALSCVQGKIGLGL